MPTMKKTSGAKARKDRAGAPVTLEPPLSKTEKLFPIVGIGASAGGLEALEVFLARVPDSCGAAFVIVQHLDPTYKGMMVELLQRKTPMPVAQVTNRLRVASDHVYLIPPNTDMSILHGVLHLLEPSARRGLRLPIDFFFRSLALDCQSRSIGVILSGMGSDGTLGLKVIKEKGGAVFVQTPDSAKFDSMPRSAIAAGLADVVAPVDELAGRIAAYLNYAPLDAKVDPVRERTVQSSLEKIIILVRTQTGHDFSLYKKSTFYRRIERRMGLHQLDKITDYVRYLRDNPQEIELLFKEMLIGVTGFFRDPPAWEQLKDEIIPTLLAAYPKGGELRAWVCGCSTGEEAYSLVMLFREALDQVKPAGNFKLQVFATDLDRDAIDKARIGSFPANIAAEVSDERLRRFFFKDEPGYRMLKEIRETVIFAHHNVITDPPFTKMDLLVCRNLMIYLEQKTQKNLLPLFHYSLKPGGILFLGSAETIGAFTSLFVPLAGNNRFYRRIDTPLWKEPLAFPTVSFSPRPLSAETSSALVRRPGPNLQSLAEQFLLRRHCPAAVLTNDQGDILYVNGRTGKYLEPAAGRANWNIFAMAREGLRYLLNSAWRKALQQKTATGLNRLQVQANGDVQTVDVTVEQISEPSVLQGMVLITFRDVETPYEIKSVGKAHRVTDREALERELEQARKEIEICREEMRTSQEEVKSTNEEFQSTNEELQSTNEELTTSREEMQSLNEELQTINHELQIKVNELSQANNDMKNLLNSTDIATLFLDDDLLVRRFTDQTTSIIKLIPGDAGRPITDIATDLDYPKMAADATEVLRTLVFVEKEVATRDGRWFQVRIMPYRTLENRIDGVVITFSNITVAKTLEARLRQALAGAEKKVEVKGHA
jgi:two-component system, chemotaxis family, CheB/CheR fusion protein